MKSQESDTTAFTPFSFRLSVCLACCMYHSLCLHSFRSLCFSLSLPAVCRSRSSAFCTLSVFRSLSLPVSVSQSVCLCLTVSQSVCLTVSQSICLSVSVCLSDCQSVCLSVSVWLSVSQFVCLSLSDCQSVSLSGCLCLSDCQSVCLSVWLSVSLSVCLSLWCTIKQTTRGKSCDRQSAGMSVLTERTVHPRWSSLPPRPPAPPLLSPSARLPPHTTHV